MDAIKKAVEKNKVQTLLNDPSFDPLVNGNFLIKYAAQDKFIKSFKVLLSDPRINPTFNNNYLIQKASEKGQSKVVELLLADPRVDPGANDNYAIRYASKNGHLDTVLLLLSSPNVDPGAKNGYSSFVAFTSGFFDIARVLDQDLLKYPTYNIRKHNLPLNQSIDEIESKISGLREEKNFYTARNREMAKMHKAGRQVNMESEMVVTLQLEILNSMIRKLENEQNDLRKQLVKIYR